MKSTPENPSFEDQLGSALRKSIGEMPAPQVDLAPQILARIAARPSRLTLALQCAVLLVLGAVAVSETSQSLAWLGWPGWSGWSVDWGWSLQGLDWFRAAWGSWSGWTEGLAFPMVPAGKLALFSLLGLAALNVLAARQPVEVGGRA